MYVYLKLEERKLEQQNWKTWTWTTKLETWKVWKLKNLNLKF